MFLKKLLGDFQERLLWISDIFRCVSKIYHLIWSPWDCIDLLCHLDVSHFYMAINNYCLFFNNGTTVNVISWHLLTINTRLRFFNKLFVFLLSPSLCSLLSLKISGIEPETLLLPARRLNRTNWARATTNLALPVFVVVASFSGVCLLAASFCIGACWQGGPRRWRRAANFRGQGLDAVYVGDTSRVRLLEQVAGNGGVPDELFSDDDENLWVLFRLLLHLTVSL